MIERASPQTMIGSTQIAHQHVVPAGSQLIQCSRGTLHRFDIRAALLECEASIPGMSTSSSNHQDTAIGQANLQLVHFLRTGQGPTRSKCSRSTVTAVLLQDAQKLHLLAAPSGELEPDQSAVRVRQISDHALVYTRGPGVAGLPQARRGSCAYRR